MAALEGATILVTGGNGFVGQHLLTALAGYSPEKCHATTLDAILADPTQSTGSIGAVEWHQLDITDRQATFDLVATLKPDVIFHLAAQSHIPTSFANPELTWQVNLHGTLNLLEAAVKANPAATFINTGSSDMYGASFQAGEPVHENSPLLPLNPYAASKAAADLAAWQYAANSSLQIIRARPFNHAGPGQAVGFVLPDFAAQIARIEADLQEAVIAVGDLSAERDFLHVEDVVNAYIQLARSNTITSGSVFNIASGQATTIANVLDLMLQSSSATIRVTQDPERLRPADIHRVCGDSSAIRSATGWAPHYSLHQLVADLLDHWRTRVAAGDCP